MKKIWVFLLFFVLVNFAIADTVVEFIDGNFYLQKDSVWIELLPGDIIIGGSVLRVGEYTTVELFDGKTKFSLTKPGIFSIDSISLEKKRSTKAKFLIFSIIERLIKIQSSDLGSSPSTVFGVRAAEVRDDGFSWTSEEYTEYLELGKEYLLQEDYPEAKLNFSDALDSSFNDFEETEALFYLSYTEAVSGDPNKALSLLDNYFPDYHADYYEQSVLLKANLLIDNLKYDEAILWIDSHKSITEDISGSLLFLEAISNYQLGNIDKAQKLFRTIIDNDFEFALIAAEYLDLM